MLSCSKIKANYSCGYYASHKGFLTGTNYWELNVDFEVDESNQTVSFLDKRSSRNAYYIFSVMDFEMGEDYSPSNYVENQKTLVNKLHGTCPNYIFVCKGNNYSSLEATTESSIVFGYSVVFDPQYQTSAINFNGIVYRYDYTGTHTLEEAQKNIDSYVEFNGRNECFTVDIYSSSNNNVSDRYGSSCDFVNYYLNGSDTEEKIDFYYSKCIDGDRNACDRYNYNKNVIRNYCYSTLQFTNYNNPCIDVCTNDVSKKFEQLEATSNVKSCHLSDKIINFAANILKWGKYFAPVLVIILSILDFIKAIAAQKDEDMKKAQERFIKRLIAAVLLFMLPLIIYFVLDKFNLINDDPFCNIFPKS